jgi:sentrin-specific protease 1
MRMLFGQERLDPNERGTYNFANVARWSKKVPGGNIFNLRYLLIPINISDLHWTLAVVFMEDRCIQYYDSLPDGKEIHTKIKMDYCSILRMSTRQ